MGNQSKTKIPYFKLADTETGSFLEIRGDNVIAKRDCVVDVNNGLLTARKNVKKGEVIANIPERIPHEVFKK